MPNLAHLVSALLLDGEDGATALHTKSKGNFAKKQLFADKFGILAAIFLINPPELRTAAINKVLKKNIWLRNYALSVCRDRRRGIHQPSRLQEVNIICLKPRWRTLPVLWREIQEQS